MKRIIFIFIFIFTILLTLIASTGCENENVKKLKKEIAVTDASCPINMGIAGDLLSIKYQEEENRVILYYSVNEELGNVLFIKKNKEKLLQQLRLLISKSEYQQLLKDVVNAQASLMIIYKAPSSGKTVKFELPYEELKELRTNPMSNSEIQRLTIENKIEVENTRCPYKVDEGTTITKVALVDGYIVYYYEMDESLFYMKELKRHQNELKEYFRENLKSICNDMTMQNELQMLVGQNIGSKYRCYGNKSKEYVDVVFTPEELSIYLKQ